MNKYLLRYLRKLNQKPITDKSRDQFDNAMIVLGCVAIAAIAWALYVSEGVR